MVKSPGPGNRGIDAIFNEADSDGDGLLTQAPFKQQQA
jgi:hypothetical protein